jgi:hypothetical protein
MLEKGMRNVQQRLRSGKGMGNVQRRLGGEANEDAARCFSREIYSTRGDYLMRVVKLFGPAPAVARTTSVLPCLKNAVF